MSKLFGTSSFRKLQIGSWVERLALELATACGLVRFGRLSMAILLGLSLAAFFTPVMGEAVNGAFVGTITDSTGASVAGAKVTITEQNQNVSRSATTNDNGFYSFPDVPPGLYKVTAEKTGFKTRVRPNIDLPVSNTIHVDLALQPGSISETITVEALIPPLQTDSA